LHGGGSLKSRMLVVAQLVSTFNTSLEHLSKTAGRPLALIMTDMNPVHIHTLSLQDPFHYYPYLRLHIPNGLLSLRLYHQNPGVHISSAPSVQHAPPISSFDTSYHALPHYVIFSTLPSHPASKALKTLFWNTAVALFPYRREHEVLQPNSTAGGRQSSLN